MNLGDRVRAEREAQQISRAELARAAGIATSTLSDLELGLSKGTTALHKVAARLGVRPEWLETGKGHKTAAPGTSQAVGLNAEKLADLLETVEAAIAQSGRQVPVRTKARLVAALYADEQASAAGSAQAVQAALASILATLEHT